MNIVLWIVWSGEWFQDILFGIPYMYLFWLLMRGLISREVLSQKERWLAAAAGTLVMSMLTPRYVMEGDVFNYASFAVTIAVTVWLGVLSVRRKDFFLATTFFLWTQLSMFLFSDVYYYVFFFANTIAMMVMFPLVKKELAADG